MEKMALLGVGTGTATLLAMQEWGAHLRLHADPRIDALIKAAIGAALVVWASKVKGGAGHQILLGVGGGLVAISLIELFQSVKG
jgi:hypothetical protein